MARSNATDYNSVLTPVSIGIDLITSDRGTVPLNQGAVREFYIIEDLEQAFRTAKLIFQDVDYLYEFLPFTGNEKIQIEIGQDTEGIKKKITFDIFNFRIIGGIEGNKTEIFELILVESGWYEMVTKKVPKAFEARKTTEIISSLISDNTDASLNLIEKSNKSFDLFVVPVTWTVMDAVKYLLGKSVSENGGWGWLMWTGGERQQKLNIQTLENLLQDTKNKSKADERMIFKSTYPYSPDLILAFNVLPIDKFLLTRSLGGGTYFGYAKDSKAFGVYSTTLAKELPKITLLGTKALFTTDLEDPTAHVESLQWDTDTDGENIHRNKVVKEYFNQQQLEVVTYGRINRWAGKSVEIQWESKLDPNSTQYKKYPYNEALRGLWVMKTVIHSFNLNQKGSLYTNKIRLCKNGFTKATDSKLIKGG